ncbi:hypothetical protein V8C26DRAFT_396869 [Trichoderma gracile]
MFPLCLRRLVWIMQNDIAATSISLSSLFILNVMCPPPVFSHECYPAPTSFRLSQYPSSSDIMPCLFHLLIVERVFLPLSLL